MTDLVKRLRAIDKDIILRRFDPEMSFDGMTAHEAASRIEKLEAALGEIAAGYETEWSTSTMRNMFDVAQILSERINIARKALEGKDG